MTPRTLFALALTSLVLLGSLLGCRDPLLAEDDTWVPDAGVFDASADDDAGPGALCPEDSPDYFNNAYSPYIGGEESVDLTVVDFSYFRCPHCADFSELFREVWADRPDFMKRVRFYFHHFPFNYEVAWNIHACTVAAGNQGMENFWAMHDYIYDSMLDGEQRGVEELTAFADDVLNLDMVKFNFDREDPATMSFLQWDKSQAQAVGVTGTPSVFICGSKIGWSSIEDYVDSYLNP